MAKKEACKCKEVECEECPEWIFTLADLIMCMMGLFVLLWVLKPAPGKSGSAESDEEWIKVAAAIREAFGHLPDPASTDPIDKYILMKKLEQLKTLKPEGDGGKTKLERKGAEGDEPEVKSIRPGNQVLTGSRIMFEVGGDALGAESKKALDQIAMLIKGHRNVMLVKGHTSVDDLPESADSQMKMELSIRRAKVVADYLVKAGVEPDILRVQGCSTFEPIRQRAYTPESRQMNRRVEVESTTLLVAELQDPSGAKTSSTPESLKGPAAADHAVGAVDQH